MSFAARYAGQCNECDERFPEGAMIKYNERDEVVHDSCPNSEDPTVLSKGEKVCGGCQTVHPPGECW